MLEPPTQGSDPSLVLITPPIQGLVVASSSNKLRGVGGGGGGHGVGLGVDMLSDVFCA